jgi:hypothetical protein
LALTASGYVVLFWRRLKLPGLMLGFMLLVAGAARIVSAASDSGFTTRAGGIVLALLRTLVPGNENAFTGV